jgi:septum formation protein
MARGLVIGSDTIVVSRGRGLGKPADADAATAMLRRLSGCRHDVFTGVAAIDTVRRRSATGSACSRVVFRRLSEDEIRDYVRTGEPMDKAGAYAIQGRAGRFVAGVAGPVDNVIGLPVACLAAVIRRVLP